MKTVIKVSILMLLFTIPVFTQTPESFFPTQVGNLWQYQGDILWMDWRITRDSIALNGDRYLFTVGKPFLYRIDTLFNVYERYSNDDEFWVYDLNANSGEAWVRCTNSAGHNYYGWVQAIVQGIVFGRVTTIKVIRFGPLHPDSGGSSWYYWEQYLASGFGVIYHWEEPGYVSFLRGCVVAGDTFGTLVSVAIDEKCLPTDFTLSQNYPNPFNPNTTLQFSLPTQSSIRFAVYDLLGREVAILFDEKKEAGTYKIVFDGSKLPSGIYTAKLQAGERILTKRMTLIK
jgi:hypothetical protein